MPRRRPNRDLRTREHLTEAEVERLMKATKDNRYGHRDATMILVAYRHGLRVPKLVDLRWEQINFRTAPLHVRRVKQGTPSAHPILGVQLSERRAPLSAAGYQRMVARAGVAAKFTFLVHTPTCCGTPAGSSSPTTATTLAPSKHISATAQSCPLCAIRLGRPIGSSIFGRIEFLSGSSRAIQAAQ
jgi:integrase